MTGTRTQTEIEDHATLGDLLLEVIISHIRKLIGKDNQLQVKNFVLLMVGEQKTQLDASALSVLWLVH